MKEIRGRIIRRVVLWAVLAAALVTLFFLGILYQKHLDYATISQEIPVGDSKGFSWQAHGGSPTVNLPETEEADYLDFILARNPAIFRKNLSFSSSKPKIVSVDSKGGLKGLKTGSALITVKSGPFTIGRADVLVQSSSFLPADGTLTGKAPDTIPVGMAAFGWILYQKNGADYRIESSSADFIGGVSSEGTCYSKTEKPGTYTLRIIESFHGKDRVLDEREWMIE